MLREERKEVLSPPYSIYFILYWSLLVGQVMNSLLSRFSFATINSDLLCCVVVPVVIMFCKVSTSGREAPPLLFFSDLVINNEVCFFFFDMRINGSRIFLLLFAKQ